MKGKSTGQRTCHHFVINMCEWSLHRISNCFTTNELENVFQSISPEIVDVRYNADETFHTFCPATTIYEAITGAPRGCLTFPHSTQTHSGHSVID